jgi:hypothetical protein
MNTTNNIIALSPLRPVIAWSAAQSNASSILNNDQSQFGSQLTVDGGLETSGKNTKAHR